MAAALGALVAGTGSASTGRANASAAEAAAIDGPPFSLTVEQLFQWTPGGTLSEPRNRSTVPLAPRFIVEKDGGDPRVRVMISPDGMNNFANYLTRQPKFNLYTFAQWSHVDILNWFAGTADRTVNIPSRPWIDAAHRNGVKVIGTVFFAPVPWGGSPATVERFLRQDADGKFPAADRLVALARFYGFDGWLINEETGLDERHDGDRIIRDPALAAHATEIATRMRAFMAYLKAISPQPMEVHWVEAMLPDGSVGWQNELNARNAPLLQDGGRALADGIFVNYQWNVPGLRSGAALAERLGRSRYDLFIGADLWPLRDNAQAAFANAHWLDDMTDPATGKGYGSIALFAPNFNFNYPGNATTPRFSRFDTDAGDVDRFYDAETRLFAGDGFNLSDRTPRRWKGLGALVPPRGIVTDLPFRTSFNLGHGRREFRRGVAVGGPWHDMGRQDVLPTWQFAYTPGAPLAVRYGFGRAYEGGSALLIVPSARIDRPAEVSLYALRAPVASRLTVTAATLTGASGYSVRLRLSDGKMRALPIVPGAGWRVRSWCIVDNRPQSIATLGIGVDRGVSDSLTLGVFTLQSGCSTTAVKKN